MGWRGRHTVGGTCGQLVDHALLVGCVQFGDKLIFKRNIRITNRHDFASEFGVYKKRRKEWIEADGREVN